MSDSCYDVRGGNVGYFGAVSYECVSSGAHAEWAITDENGARSNVCACNGVKYRSVKGVSYVCSADLRRGNAVDVDGSGNSVDSDGKSVLVPGRESSGAADVLYSGAAR